MPAQHPCHDSARIQLPYTRVPAQARTCKRISRHSDNAFVGSVRSWVGCFLSSPFAEGTKLEAFCQLMFGQGAHVGCIVLTAVKPLL